MLGSGVWLIASERFDPRTAKKHFGEIAAAGTLGGLVGGLVAARVAAAADVAAMLPLVAALQAACAWQLRGASRATGRMPELHKAGPAADKTPSGLQVLIESAYLQRLAALVLLGTLCAIFIDYIFMVQVKATSGKARPSEASFRCTTRRSAWSRSSSRCSAAAWSSSGWDLAARRAPRPSR
jgi:ATP/ADP translocase